MGAAWLTPSWGALKAGAISEVPPIMLEISAVIVSQTGHDMARLTSKARNKLPAKTFAGPGRSFPIPDKSHARAALQDLPRAKGLTGSEKAKIRSRAESKLGKGGKAKGLLG